jgi:uncharacterized membrane protein YbaN (DUF454 family)
MSNVARSRTLRVVYLALGLISLAIGVAGIVLPLVPTTPLVLLAAFFFSRSSPRFDAWLVGHRLFGPLVRDWRAARGLTLRAKGIAVAAIVLTFAFTIGFAIEALPLRAVLVVLGVGLVTYILRLPTKRSKPEPIS